MKKLLGLIGAVLLGIAFMPAGCGDDDGGGSGGSGAGGRLEDTGAVCEAPADCYPDIDPAALQGDALCLDRVRGGYCTHTCAADADCCAAEGECEADIHEVCSPFESTGETMCFLSCEPGDLVPAPGQNEPVDEQEFCQRAAGRDFMCRSSGGGSENRKVCVPGDCGVGAACSAGTDCAGDLECVSGLLDGYCTRQGCTTNAGCPAGSMCVQHGDGESYCFKACVGDSDCTFCRGFDDGSKCTPDVEFFEAGTTGSVCVPG